MSDESTPETCPRCKSEQIALHRQERPLRDYWACSGCGNVWNGSLPVRARRPLSPKDMTTLRQFFAVASALNPEGLHDLSEQDRADRRRVR